MQSLCLFHTGQSGTAFVTPQLAQALPPVRLARDPPTAVTGGTLLPESSGAVPVAVTSGAGAKTLSLVPFGSDKTTNSSLSEAVKEKWGESPQQKSLLKLIDEGKSDLQQGLSIFESDDDEEMNDAKDNLKRDHGHARQDGQSDASDQATLLAPFPLQPNPTEFVRLNMRQENHAAVQVVPWDEWQQWLMDSLKNVLFTFSEADRNSILSHPKEHRFSVLKHLHETCQSQAK